MHPTNKNAFYHAHSSGGVVLTRKPGLPTGDMGRIGLAHSKDKPNRMLTASESSVTAIQHPSKLDHRSKSKDERRVVVAGVLYELHVARQMEPGGDFRIVVQLHAPHVPNVDG